jgi:ferrochelatase
MTRMPRTAVILFNLGGPDTLASVRPFLFNLFSDKAIIGLPTPFRLMIAWLIARRRERVAQDIYERMGGASPLLKETQAQAIALEDALGDGTRAFIAMRYWHPLTGATAAQVKAWRPERIVLLPLYPQFSTTTTASSLALWKAEAARAGLEARTAEITAYPELPGMVAAQAQMIDAALAQAGAESGGTARILFSAHGLPKRIVAKGDPYPEQVMLTARAVAKALGDRHGRRDAEWRVCYQSRVGPVEWIGPYTDDEIRRAGTERKALVVVPIAFVSEHSETLVELDMDYRKIAAESGVPAYIRVPALGVHPEFIGGLAELVRNAFPYGS